MTVWMDWFQASQEYRAWGANWQTLGAVGAISMTALQVTGLISQISRLKPSASSKRGSIEFRVYAWNLCLFLACVSYAIDIKSIAMLCSGVGVATLHPIVLYRLAKSGEVAKKQWRNVAWFPLIVMAIVFLPEPWRSTAFFVSNAGCLIPMWLQYRLLKRSRRTGNLDARMLGCFTVSLAFWVVYSFAIRNPVLMIINPALFAIQAMILWQWTKNRRTEMRGIIFDCDMVLVNSFKAIHDGFCAVCQEDGVEPPDPETFRHNCAQPFIDVFRRHGVTMKDDLVWATFAPPFSDLSRMSGYVGNVEMLSRLKDAGIPIAVISSATPDLTVPKLQHFGLFQYVDEVMGGTHCKVDLILEFCQKYRLNPRQVMMVGDMISDVADANEAGTKPLGVVGPFADYEKLASAGAKWVAGTHQEMQATVLEQFFPPLSRTEG